MWRDMYRTEYAILDDDLYFKVDYPGIGHTFTLPMAGGRDTHFQRIAEYCCAKGYPMAFYPVTEHELATVVKQFPNSRVESNRDAADYLYTSESLKYFKGKKLSGQRNHVNRFLKNYEDWQFQPLEMSHIPEVKEFFIQYNTNQDKSSDSFLEERNKVYEVLDNMELYGMFGGILRVNGAIVGFALGEIQRDTLFTHIEKGNREFLGCYQMLVSQFAQMYAVDGVEFINREDDAGDLGLRKSKTDYHPVEILEKNTVIVDCPCGCQG